MSDIAPVREQSRIKSLDVMRGFAVLGILIVNAAYFAAPWQTGLNPALPPLAVTDETLWSWFIMHVFFEFKCITLFSLLFGVSIYLVGGEREDKARGALLRSRLFWLLIIGLIHATLIWNGDILVTYAITAFFVMLARSWSPRALLMVGGLLLILSIGVQSMFALFIDFIPPPKLAEIEEQIYTPSPETVQAMIAAYQGGVMSAIQQNVTTWVEFLSNSLLVLIIRTAGVMMIGLALFKLGFLSGNARAWVYWLFAALGAVALGVIGYQAWLNAEGGFTFRHMMAGGAFANTALAIFGSLGYASILILLVKAGARFITEPLAAVGRMAFTNYLTQSIIMTTIFWGGRGFGLYGEVDRPTLMAIVVAIWVLQLIWSPLWLARFQMGPLEWIWRRLSYGRPVAMAKA